MTEPVWPKATSLILNSGNVVSSDRLKKKTNLNPQDEVGLTKNIKIMDRKLKIYFTY